MTSEPHAGRLQCLTSGQQIPAEDAAAAVRVDIAVGAVLVPESAAVEHGAVALVVAAGPLVVVAVERREHHSVVVAESVATRVTRVPGHLRAASSTGMTKYRKGPQRSITQDHNHEKTARLATILFNLKKIILFIFCNVVFFVCFFCEFWSFSELWRFMKRPF